jgi:primase-polymerase (primpol)-like protein
MNDVGNKIGKRKTPVKKQKKKNVSAESRARSAQNCTQKRCDGASSRREGRGKKAHLGDDAHEDEDVEDEAHRVYKHRNTERKRPQLSP